MNKKTTLVLLLLLIALGVGYVFMLRIESDKRQKTFEAKRVFDFEPDQIYSVEIQRGEDAPASATRSQGKPWAMVKPNATIQPNQVIWNRIAVALSSVQNERTIEKKAADLAKYGLDKPSLTITLSKPDGAQSKLAFGLVDATQSYRYALDDNGSAFLVSVKAFQELDRPLEYLRYPYVVTVGEQGVTKFEYSRFWNGKPPADNAEKKDKKPDPGEESVVVTVEKGDDGRWRLTTPIQADANQDMINELVKQIQFATGRNYVEQPQSLADYSLDPPKARITVYSGPGSEPQTLYFGSLESTDNAKKPTKEEDFKGIFARNSARPAVFVIDANIGTLLPKTPDAFRERRLLTHAATDLRTIHYKTAETDVVLKNDPDRGWTLEGSEPNEGSQQSASNFVAFLKTLEGKSFPGDVQPQYGFDAPSIDITLEYANNPNPSSIRVGARVPDAEQYYAQQDTGVTAILNAVDVAGLTKRQFDFSDRSLLRYHKLTIARFDVIFEGVKYSFDRSKGQWMIKEPQNRTIGGLSDIIAMIALLSTATATDIETNSAPDNLAPYGLDNPIAVITAASPKRDAPGEEIVYGPLVIGATTPDDSQARFATTSLRPGVYRIPQSIVDSIREALKVIH
jgi:hypothetical protein